jgi:F-type H+-transporting ATPase subunit a
LLSTAAFAQGEGEPAAENAEPAAAPAVEHPELPFAPPPTEPAVGAHAAPAPPEGEAEGGGHGEHWTVFSLIPMGWTLDVGVKIASWMGVAESDLDKSRFTNEGLLHVQIMFFVLILLTLVAVIVGGRYKRMLAAGDPAPRPGVSIGNFVEAIVQALLGLMEEIIGHGSQKYLPLIGTLAFVILFNNLLGLIPGFYVATDNENTTLAMAVTVFVIYHYYGMKTHGVGKYLAHFMGPLEGKVKYIMAPLMVPVELIAHFARPLSLSLRLMGNMTGDHKVFGVFMGLVAIPAFYPLPFLALGLLVAVVQTLVFCMLTMVYIGMATAKEH